MVYTTNEYCREVFGKKLYKISLNAGMTCPNRDGKLDSRGCIFCSEGGSGDFAASAEKNISAQIEEAKKRIEKKFKGNEYIAYFQAFTNTYAPVEFLRSLYFPVVKREDIAVLSIATRPDCLGEEVLELIQELNAIKPVWIELGLQTIHQKTIDYIRRGYATDQYDLAVKELKKIGVHVITHVILGLPGENVSDMCETVKHVAEVRSDGIKLQLLHVLKGTDLEKEYLSGSFKTLSMEEYIEILKECMKYIPEEMVIHRITGDGPKKTLLAPLWSADKKRVLNAIHKALEF